MPSWYGAYAVVLALAALVGALRKRKAWDEATDSLTEVAKLLAQRMGEGDKRDDRMAELTEAMAAMTEPGLSSLSAAGTVHAAHLGEL
ncbi:hypothetical protein [Streptomyces chiangmaiensis]|uniref:Uncharacterized protein n=1 Tax=Streptomyces chiangmaiensis TaxID=766497 RepID=A0ABU7FJ32_9ACTN|nr:hypothetical protein [Streptomyces chiangmaiensis]MED7824136.1 hypothetical protein [Streptomyces chiangmaiensis]